MTGEPFSISFYFNTLGSNPVGSVNLDYVLWVVMII
jgi:hypothetical protein